MKRLPNKLSELMKVALTDLELVESDPSYIIIMDQWHKSQRDSFINKCEVCAAGAVIAKTLKGDMLQTLLPDDFDDNDIGEKLRAINSLRVGEFGSAFFELGLNPPNFPTFYGDDECDLDDLSQYSREEWKEHMCAIIGILQSEGL